VRILRITMGSSTVATTRMRPPQWGQASTSTENVWRVRAGHDHRRGAGGGGSSTASVVAASRFAAGVHGPELPPFPDTDPETWIKVWPRSDGASYLIFLDRRCARQHRNASLRICIDKDIARARPGN